MISPDAPVQNSSEDTLGRVGFAAMLTKAMAGVTGEDSLVIGIHGRWGSGKSSVLNLVVEQIAAWDKSRAEQDRLHVLASSKASDAFGLRRRVRGRFCRGGTSPSGAKARIIRALNGAAEAAPFQNKFKARLDSNQDNIPNQNKLRRVLSEPQAVTAVLKNTVTGVTFPQFRDYLPSGPSCLLASS